LCGRAEGARASRRPAAVPKKACRRSTGSSTRTGLFWVNTPIITASDTEGAGALFRVSTLDLANLPRIPEGKVDFAPDFFEAFLTVSGQLNIEAYCLTLSKVYTFGPTFRAENSNTQPPLGRILDDQA
jgi:aspartyl/asparaginyl-tRNA synthetase